MSLLTAWLPAALLLGSVLSDTSDGKDSEVTGTEGASAMLPCVFTRPPRSLAAHMVTWMRKNPYRHIVTFRHHRKGSWAAENGATRYELVGDPELGNASTRIKELSVEDSHSYLCLAEFRTRNDLKITMPLIINLLEYEAHLLIRPVTQTSTVVLLLIPVGMKIFTLLVMGIISYKTKLSVDPD